MQTRETPHPTSRDSRLAPVGVVVGVTLVVMLLVALLGLVGRPGYTSSAQVYVAGSSTAQPAGSVSPRVASFVALAQSRQLAARVDRRLDLAGSPADLQGRIHAEAVPGTVLVRLDVTASRASSARRTAAGVLAELDRLGRNISGAPSGSASTLRTATGPSLPSERDGRHLTHNVLAVGLPVGIVAGLLGALVLVRRPRPLRSRDEVAAALGVPVLGELTRDPRDLASRTAGDTGVDGVEGLRDNVRFLGVDSVGPLVVVAGPADHGDVLETAIGLASSITRTGSPVLLVDADLRSATLAPRIGLPREPGLSNVLAGDVTLSDAVQVAPADGLHVLNAGPTPPNPRDLIASATLRRVLSSARAEHHTVIVVVAADGPPDEAARLAAATDGALLVVRPGSLTDRDLRTTARGLSARGAAILGTVLVRAPGDAADAAGSSSAEVVASAAPPGGPPTPAEVRATVQPDGAEADAVAHEDRAEDQGQDQDYVPSFFTDPESWSETGPLDLDPAEPGSGGVAAADRVDSWAIRQTPDDPEPFWVSSGPVPTPAEETRSLSMAEMQAEVAARALDETPEPSPSVPERTASRSADTDASQSPWLSRDGEEWTPPVPAAADGDTAVEPHPLVAQQPWAGGAESVSDVVPDPVPGPVQDAPDVLDPLGGVGADRSEGDAEVEDWAVALGADPVDQEPVDQEPADQEPVEGLDEPDALGPDAVHPDVAVSPPEAVRSVSSPTIADRVAETLRALRQDATLDEPNRRGPLSAGELAGLSGHDRPGEDTGSATPAGPDPSDVASETPQDGDDPTPAGALDEAMTDDEPWADPEDDTTTADPTTADPLTGDPGPGTGGDPTPDPTDVGGGGGEPRTGSLLDEFLTEDADDADLEPQPDPGPDPGTPSRTRREDRGSLWRPSRWRDG